MIAIKNWADKNVDYEYIVYPVVDNNISSRKIPESMGGKIEREYEETTGLGQKVCMLEYRIHPQSGL
jgi:hypothetical protein